MCSYLLWKTKEKYSSCQGLLLDCIFLLLRSPESCVTVLVDIQMQTLKHSARRKKENNWIVNVPDNGVELFCCLLLDGEKKNLQGKDEFRVKIKLFRWWKNWQIKPDLHSLFTFNVFLSFLIKSLQIPMLPISGILQSFFPLLSRDDWNTCWLNRCDDLPGGKKKKTGSCSLPLRKPKHPE